MACMQGIDQRHTHACILKHGKLSAQNARNCMLCMLMQGAATNTYVFHR